MLAWIKAALKSPPQIKASRTATMVAMQSLGQPRWTPRDMSTMMREGFLRNPVGYRAVRLIAEAAADVPIVLMQGREELDEHPLLDVLRQPNPRQAGAAFLEAVVGHLLTAGNAYIEGVWLEPTLRELHVLRPDRMRVIPGPDGWAEGYLYQVGSESLRFDQREGILPPILHLTLFHPLDDHYGLSPLEAASQAVDIHNTASNWNKALLDNAARPSGALVYATDAGALSDEQFDRLKDELEANYQGAMNAGRPLLLEGGLDWKPMSLSPRDMDFQEARNGAARDIALAFGVPPMLLGIPGDATYSNYVEANRSLYRLTVLPLLRRITQSLTHWLAPVFPNERLTLVPDLDQIEALAEERASLWERVGKADFLSRDEKRLAVGYGHQNDPSQDAAHSDIQTPHMKPLRRSS